MVFKAALELFGCPDYVHFRKAFNCCEAYRGKSHGAFSSALAVMGLGCGTRYNLRKFAVQGGKLLCFEADPNFHDRLNKTFLKARRDTPGLRTELVPAIFGVTGHLDPDSVTRGRLRTPL